VRVVAPAIPPPQPSSPKSVLVLALSVIGGLGAGMGVALLRTMTDRVFRTAGQIESVLHVPCIALVPLVKKGPVGIPTSPLPNPTAVVGLRRISHDESVFWKVVDSPLSAFAEAIRTIKLAADLQSADGLNTVVGFTSSIPNEGKTTAAAALALQMGQAGHRVMVIDCDLRNPSLTRALAPGATSGIVDVLSGEKSLEEACWKCPVTKVTFLPSIESAGLLHTSEILASPAIKKLFEQLRRSYDYIVVDLPPLAPIIDVRATGHLVDFYFLVVEWGGTKIDVVQHAINRSHPVSEGFVGAILNKTEMHQIGRYDARLSDYYSNRHYGRYGYTD
jgi:succinoglycan biosynthesis transport protein ExoP